MQSLSQNSWKLKYGQLRAIAERICRMRMDRARKVWFDATSGTWDGCSVGNASIARVGIGWGAGPNGRKIIKAARVADLAITNGNPEHCDGPMGHAKLLLRAAIAKAEGTAP